ncbi:uncharacterized protein B0P05DRAFT_575603 [Gilbertella persicaria]|uniref:uncharacterized protein n=1 Tax=Gilbertella persicaria TaxID=101096 RepID=UPI00221E9CA5|nr:uncharacterized protein B0P05DRAFT_575603 [Gilbertella persicaria]KAI8051887.1 hypothetical protein B0P05DRAFT_575603 [Gilbertella persicaria]
MNYPEKILQTLVNCMSTPNVLSTFFPGLSISLISWIKKKAKEDMIPYFDYFFKKSSLSSTPIKEVFEEDPSLYEHIKKKRTIPIEKQIQEPIIDEVVLEEKDAQSAEQGFIIPEEKLKQLTKDETVTHEATFQERSSYQSSAKERFTIAAKKYPNNKHFKSILVNPPPLSLSETITPKELVVHKRKNSDASEENVSFHGHNS